MSVSRRAMLGLLAAGSLAAPLAAPLAANLSGPASAATLSPRPSPGRFPDRGINIPGWTDAGGAPADAVLEALHRLGFRSIRLPVDPLAVPDDGAAGTIARIASGLVARRFSVTVDLHPTGPSAERFARSPADGGHAAAAAWARLAPRLADLPAEGCFLELLNEPPLDRDDWLSLRGRLRDVVRRTCPDHTLVWGASRYQSPGETVGHPLLDDDNAIAAVHYYWPVGFTHQCADWGSPELKSISGLPFPARRDDPAVMQFAADLSRRGETATLARLDGEFARDWTQAAIADDFARLAQWSASAGCTVTVNEFGVLDHCVDAGSRLGWARAVRAAAEDNGFGWTWWEIDRGFGIAGDRTDPASIDAATVAALLPQASGEVVR